MQFIGIASINTKKGENEKKLSIYFNTRLSSVRWIAEPGGADAWKELHTGAANHLQVGTGVEGASLVLYHDPEPHLNVTQNCFKRTGSRDGLS
jgi:hypothetical protein